MKTLEAMRIAREHDVTPIDISERTGHTPSNVTGVLDRLEQAGWIARTHNRKDRRSTFITPTERAFEIFTPCV